MKAVVKRLSVFIHSVTSIDHHGDYARKAGRDQDDHYLSE